MDNVAWVQRLVIVVLLGLIFGALLISSIRLADFEARVGLALDRIIAIEQAIRTK